MLIITNGDSAAAAIRAAGIDANLLPWRDVLHDGPIPEGLDLEALSSVRVAYLSDCGWGEPAQIEAGFRWRDRILKNFRQQADVLLWFEHDLYDQLQLLQVLAWFCGRELGETRLTLICEAEYIAEASPARLKESYSERREVTPCRLELAWRIWTALRAPTPENLTSFLAAGTPGFPYLAGALKRFLEEYPSPCAGLSRSERQILEDLVAGPLTPAQLFKKTSQREEPRYLGDRSFWSYLEALTGSENSLLSGVEGAFQSFETSQEEVFHGQQVSITPLGEDVLAGRRDRLHELGINKWLGGVHLRSGNIWRWDHATQEMKRD